MTTLLTELQPANTPERQLHVAKAVASALASAFDYGDADFKWSHGSNLMFVLSLLSPKSLASGRDWTSTNTYSVHCPAGRGGSGGGWGGGPADRASHIGGSVSQVVICHLSAVSVLHSHFAAPHLAES